MLRYVTHVAVYRAMRAAGCIDRDSVTLGERWPKDFLPTIEGTADKLRKQYDALLAPSGQTD
jgi:hypothetical protein